MARKTRSKLQNITFSADRDLIELARERARRCKTTLNEEFRNWIQQFSKSTREPQWYAQFMKQFSDIESGKKFSRSEFYED